MDKVRNGGKTMLQRLLGEKKERKKIRKQV